MLYINAFSVISCLQDPLCGVLANDFSGMRQRDDLILGKKMRFGTVDLHGGASHTAFAGNRLSLACLEPMGAALDDLFAEHARERIGIIIGSSNAAIAEVQGAVNTLRKSGDLPEFFNPAYLDIAGPSDFIAAHLGITGPSYTISTACTSSLKAFSAAERLLEVGLCDAVIVGGVDSLCSYACNGFASLEALSEGFSNPFSRNRDGITIGEGAAFFIVSRKKESALRIMGVGETSDAHHMTSPFLEGTQAAEAMRAALAAAGLAPEDIDYVSLHGTGTVLNDAMESAAVYGVFADKTPCSSIKPLIGHTLGACGAVELAFCALLLETGPAVPPHPWDGERDEKIAPIFLSEGGTGKRGSLKYILSNAFAFGGSNASIVIGKE